MLASCVGIAACRGGDTPVSPTVLTSTLSEIVRSERYVFHHAPGDIVDPASQEAFHTWAESRLGVAAPRAIDYYKYRDAGELQRLTGHGGTGWADPPAFVVHVIWPWSEHEAVHVLSALLGRPSDFFNEGIAVAFQVDPLRRRFVPLWNNEPLHAVAAQLRAQGRLVMPSQMLETDAFRARDLAVSYPIAGSFVLYLIEQFGQPAMNDFFRAAPGREESAAAIQARIQRVWGRSVQALEEDWAARLAGGSE